ncbi:hypothetical protein F4815DRAFT_155334 [Daldinia loculata]|uniref:uncharacterized protein n=1 Tax=Daldinia loculata TaxID=103429 RepID=UPI0020C54CB9|nr:uncharacterized protein F4817DRAFT_314904 [Daldinia loculata]KAI1648281.1 hypothetical protein F4817DRAFT_314904 [Daldinia loculata]KAI2780312.1 hypothetical protein F4815DRAFT_155334 [Daldinia loculata]
MKVISAVAFASPIMAAALGRAVTPIADQAKSTFAELDDIQVLCGVPKPDNELPATSYSYPIGLLLSSGDKRLHIDAGPGNCKQAACGSKSGAGVIVCNDEKNGVDLLYSDIGFFAQQVYNTCKHRRDDIDYVEKGQAFCPDGWNVILTDVGTDCHASTIPSN